MVNNSGSPAYPHIKCKEGVYVLRWGWMGKLFLAALFGVLGTAGLTAYRVNAGEQDVETLKENVQVMNRNLRKMDERQRISESRDGLIAKQMRALLEANGVTERIEPPPVKPSELEELKTE